MIACFMDYISIFKSIFMIPLTVGIVDFPFTLLELILKLLLPILFLFVGYRILNMILRRLLSNSKIKDTIQKSILLWTRRILRMMLFLVLFILSSRLLGARILEYIKLFTDALNKPIFDSGNTKISFLTILLIIPVYIIASWAGKTSRGLINPDLMHRFGFDAARQFSISSLLRYGVMTIVFLIGLSIIGVNFSSITVMFGVLGIGVGFGLQGVVANLFAGIIIIISRPIKDGDRILIDQYDGTVQQIRLISTVINTITNESIIIPNARLVSEPVFNYSYSDRSIRVTNKIGVSYQTDLDYAIMLLEEIADSNPYCVLNRKNEIRVEEFGASGIEIVVITWIKDVTDKFTAHHWTNLEIWRVFRAKGIEIPFTQVDLHIKDGNIKTVQD